MTQPSHMDLSRDIGTLEATQDAQGKRLERIEEKLDTLLEKVMALEVKERERAAIEKFGLWFVGIISALVTTVLGAIGAAWFGHIWK